MTWLLGNRLITVTTSGCGSKAMRGGLCDNCWAACKSDSLSPEHTSRYTQSSLQRASSGEVSRSRFFIDAISTFADISFRFVPGSEGGE